MGYADTVGGQGLGGFAPVGVVAVVDDVVGAEGLELFGFGRGAGRCDDSCASGDGELEGEYGDAACIFSYNNKRLEEGVATYQSLG